MAAELTTTETAYRGALDPAHAREYRAWKDWDSVPFGQFDAIEDVAFRSELRQAGIIFDGTARLFEIGFGNGSFASWVVAQGAGFVGTEHDPELVRRARASGLEAHTSDIPLSVIAAGRKFDAIAAFDVLEHLTFDEIGELLATARAILTPGGKLIARFPNGDSPFSRAIQHGDITHKSVIGSGIMAQLALRTGFRVSQIRAPSFPIFGLGVRRALRRLGVHAARALVTRVINVGFHDNAPRIVTPNIVIVLESDMARPNRLDGNR